VTKQPFAPVPADKAYDEHSQALQAALQEKGFFTREIRDGIYLVTEGWYHVLVIPTDEGTVVIDAPPSISPDFVTGQNLVKAVQSITDVPISHLIYSHHHYDHIGAAKVFDKKGLTIVAQEECAALLREANDPDRPLPTTTFKDKLTLKVGQQTLLL
jgi:glyoxylase-like metal-dependent hydrolase (beta-lactamase superfamily II)